MIGLADSGTGVLSGNWKQLSDINFESILHYVKAGNMNIILRVTVTWFICSGLKVITQAY